VEDAAGQKLSAENEVVFYRLHRPRYWGKDAPNSFFGTHTLSAKPPPDDGEGRGRQLGPAA